MLVYFGISTRCEIQAHYTHTLAILRSRANTPTGPRRLITHTHIHTYVHTIRHKVSTATLSPFMCTDSGGSDSIAPTTTTIEMKLRCVSVRAEQIWMARSRCRRTEAERSQTRRMLSLKHKKRRRRRDSQAICRHQRHDHPYMP